MAIAVLEKEKQMDDLIRRQGVIDYVLEHGFYCDTEADKEYTAELIRTVFPSVDAVEVVRCKDCDNFQTDWETAFANGRHYCAIMDSIMPPEGFCSYGERKTDG